MESLPVVPVSGTYNPEQWQHDLTCTAIQIHPVGALNGLSSFTLQQQALLQFNCLMHLPRVRRPHTCLSWMGVLHWHLRQCLYLCVLQGLAAAHQRWNKDVQIGSLQGDASPIHLVNEGHNHPVHISCGHHAQ